MSSNGHAPNGPDRAIIPNGPNDSKAEVIQKELKILTVEQAIPYSPFSSIVPFDSGTNLPPTIRPETEVVTNQGHLRYCSHALYRLAIFKLNIQRLASA